MARDLRRAISRDNRNRPAHVRMQPQRKATSPGRVSVTRKVSSSSICSGESILLPCSSRRSRNGGAWSRSTKTIVRPLSQSGGRARKRNSRSAPRPQRPPPHANAVATSVAENIARRLHEARGDIDGERQNGGVEEGQHALDQRHRAHGGGRGGDVGRLRGDADHIGEIEKIDIAGLRRSRKDQPAAQLGRAVRRAGALE